MGGLIPVSKAEAEILTGSDKVLIGGKTAEEINWISQRG
jgi:hypothetical protein